MVSDHLFLIPWYGTLLLALFLSFFVWRGARIMFVGEARAAFRKGSFFWRGRVSLMWASIFSVVSTLFALWKFFGTSWWGWFFAWLTLSLLVWHRHRFERWLARETNEGPLRDRVRVRFSMWIAVLALGLVFGLIGGWMEIEIPEALSWSRAFDEAKRQAAAVLEGEGVLVHPKMQDAYLISEGFSGAVRWLVEGLAQSLSEHFWGGFKHLVWFVYFSMSWGFSAAVLVFFFYGAEHVVLRRGWRDREITSFWPAVLLIVFLFIIGTGFINLIGILEFPPVSIKCEPQKVAEVLQKKRVCQRLQSASRDAIEEVYSEDFLEELANAYVDEIYSSFYDVKLLLAMIQKGSLQSHLEEMAYDTIGSRFSERIKQSLASKIKGVFGKDVADRLQVECGVVSVVGWSWIW